MTEERGEKIASEDLPTVIGVDDKKANHEMNESILRKICRYVRCYDAQEYFEKFINNRSMKDHIVDLDLGPDISGDRIAEILKELDYEINITLVSNDQDEIYRVEKEHGDTFVAYIWSGDADNYREKLRLAVTCGQAKDDNGDFILRMAERKGRADEVMMNEDLMKIKQAEEVGGLERGLAAQEPPRTLVEHGRKIPRCPEGCKTDHEHNQERKNFFRMANRAIRAFLLRRK